MSAGVGKASDQGGVHGGEGASGTLIFIDLGGDICSIIW